MQGLETALLFGVLLQALGEVGLSSAWLRGTEWREVAQHLKGEVAERHGVSLWTGGVPQCWPPANRPWLLTPPVPPFPVLPRDQCPELPTWNTILQGTKPSGAGVCVCVGVPCQEPRRAPAEGADSTGLRWGRGFSDSCSSTCGTHQVLTGPLRAGAFSQGISGTERPSNWPQVTPEGCERTGFSAPSIWLDSRSQEWWRCGGVGARVVGAGQPFPALTGQEGPWRWLQGLRGPPYVLPVEGQEFCGCWCWVGWTPHVHLRTKVGAQVIPGSLQGLSLCSATEGPGQSMDITPNTGMPTRVSGAARDGGCGMRLEKERKGALEGRCDRRMSLPRCIQALGATCLHLPRVLSFRHQVRGSLRAAQCQWCHLTPLAACPQRPQYPFSVTTFLRWASGVKAAEGSVSASPAPAQRIPG